MSENPLKKEIVEEKKGSATNASSSDKRDEETDLWNQLLADAQPKESIPQKHVILLGNINSGKSSLLHALQGNDSGLQTKPVALDYAYIDVYADDIDDFPVTRIHVWQTEGDPEHFELLKFAQNQHNFEHSCVVIVLDFSKPWDLVVSLNTWLDVLKRHLQSLNLSQERLNEAKRKLVWYVHQWSETEGKKKTSVSSKSGTFNVDQSSFTLPEDVLVENLGVPIIVVCTKVDTMELLAKDYGYKDAHFEYIQQYLRRICLKYGAALIYTSVKKNINIELLLHYLQHLLFGLNFEDKPQLFQKDSLFVPIGWDSIQKIEVDFQSQKLCTDPNIDFREVIVAPPAYQKRKETAVDVNVLTAEDDQSFFQRLYQSLGTEVTSGVSSNTGPSQSSSTHTAVGPHLENESSLDSRGKSSPTVFSSSLISSPLKSDLTKKGFPLSTIPSTPPTGVSSPREDLLESFKKFSLLNRQTTSSPVISSGSVLESLSRRTNLPTSPKGEDELRPKIDTSDQQVLANFFNSLINKKKPTASPSIPAFSASNESKSVRSEQEKQDPLLQGKNQSATLRESASFSSSTSANSTTNLSTDSPSTK